MVQINAAESNRASIRLIKEATWGTTPTSGVTKQVRLTKSGLETSKDTKVSEEIRSDRMIPSIIEVAASSGGDIEVEFSAGSLDDFLEAFLLSAWSKSMNFFQLKGTAVTITDTGEITLVGGDYTDYLPAVNGYIKTEGFLTPANNGYWKVSAKNFTAGDTVITITGTPLTAEAGSNVTALYDANDVIMADADITFTSGNTVDGGGNNLFGGLQVGQKVYIEGLGKESGTVVCTTTDPTEGATITVSDGVDTVVFEVRTDITLIAEGHVGIVLSGTEATMAARIAAAINAKFVAKELRVTATVSTATVTIVNHRQTGGSIATSDASAFTVTNFSGGSASKAGFFTVASLVDSDTFTTVETLTADANSGTKTVIVKGSHVRNPSSSDDIVKQSFSIETGFEDVSQYFLRKGLRVGSFSLDVKTGDIVTGKIEFMGRDTVVSTSPTLTGGGYTVLDSTTTEVLNATANVGTFLVDGEVLEGVAFKSLTIEGDASLREQRAIGEKFPAGIGYGRFQLSGSAEAYFSDTTLYNKFINHVTTGIAFDISDADLNTYIFNIPSTKITSDSIMPEGIDQDVMDSMEYTAFRDVTLKTQLIVDRFSSVYPMAQA